MVAKPLQSTKFWTFSTMQSCMIVLSCCHREGQVTIIVQMGITVHTFGGSLLEVINCVTTVLYIQIVTDVVVRTVKNQRERELQTKVQICLLYHLHTPGNLCMKRACLLACQFQKVTKIVRCKPSVPTPEKYQTLQKLFENFGLSFEAS